MWNYIDIHSHLNFPHFDLDREEIIARLKTEGIATITVGVNLATSREAIALAAKHENMFATIGLHPVDDPAGAFTNEFEALVTDPNVVAIGECGLDYARMEGDSAAQKRGQKAIFEQQIDFAVRHEKPLMIHCRDAYPDALALLHSKQKEYGSKVRGNFHFFTSPVDIARQCLEIGFTVSFTGPITYTTQYDEVVAFVPLERLMTETDAPFAAPVPYRGKRNEPAYVTAVVEKIALIKGLDKKQVAEQTVKNALQMFFTKS